MAALIRAYGGAKSAARVPFGAGGYQMLMAVLPPLWPAFTWKSSKVMMRKPPLPNIIPYLKRKRDLS